MIFKNIMFGKFVSSEINCRNSVMCLNLRMIYVYVHMYWTRNVFINNDHMVSIYL